MSNLDEMHWTQLKKAVEDAGGEWTNSDDAIEFLRSKNQADEALPGELAEGDDLDQTDESTDDAELSDDSTEDNDENVETDDVVNQLPENPEDGDPVFNKDEYFSEVFGVNTSARYLQNGHYFAGNGAFIHPDDM